MSDIWSGIGVNLQSSSDEWVYRLGGEIRGPLPKQVVADKLLNGELTLDTPVAKEGGEFHPINRVAAFAPFLKEAKKRANARLAKKRRRLLFVLLVPALAGVATAGHFIYKGVLQTRIANEERVRLEQQELEAKRQSHKEQPKLGLVALVSLGTEDDVKIRKAPEPAAKSRRPPKGKSVDSGGSAAPEPSFVKSCELSQQDIFGTLKRHLGKINHCVENEKERDAAGLPATLNLEFVVLPSGKVVEFEIGNRHYRTGLMKNCMVKAFMTISFPKSSGTNCPVSIPIKIGS